MNERIKQLAKQANIEFTYDPTETPMRAFAECWDDELKKFAELIVAECILTIQMGITRDGHNTEKYLRSMKHLKDIKEHFGVEE